MKHTHAICINTTSACTARWRRHASDAELLPTQQSSRANRLSLFFKPLSPVLQGPALINAHFHNEIPFSVYPFLKKSPSLQEHTVEQFMSVVIECSTRNTSLGAVCTRGVLYPVSSPPTPLLMRGLNGCTDMVSKSYRQRNRK